MTWLLHPKSRQAMPIVFLILVGFITFYTYDFWLSSDLLLYITYAQNLAMGNGYVDFDGVRSLGRGPGFPLMIQWACWLLGDSLQSVFWVVRFFCIANPVVVYLLGKRMFNPSVGFAAALLILSSYSVSFWSYRHLDAAWPFFTLTSVLFLYEAFDREKLSYAVLAGLLSGISFLVKESAVLFFPLPILLFAFVREFRTRRNLLHAAIGLGVTFVCIGPWLYWISETEVTGINRATGLLGSGADLIELGVIYFTGLFFYYSAESPNSLTSQFSVAPLILLAWAFVALRSFGRSSGCKVCIACFLLLTPYAAYVTWDTMRAGQLVILFLLNYLVLSFFLYSVAEWLSGLTLQVARWKQTTMVGCAFALLLLPVISFQLFVRGEVDRGGRTFLAKSYFVRVLRDSNRDSEASGSSTLRWASMGFVRGDPNEVAQWLEANATRDAVILVGDGGRQVYARKLFLATEGRLQLRDLPVIDFRGSYTPIRQESIRWKNARYPIEVFEFPSREDLLYFENRAMRGWILYESHLLNDIEENDVEYLVIGPRFHFLGEYFRSSDSFSEVASFNDGASQIFKVEKDLRSTPHDVFAGTKFIKSRFWSYWSNVLRERVGLRQSDLDRLRSGQVPHGFRTWLPLEKN